jgi:hypothetical protein
MMGYPENIAFCKFWFADWPTLGSLVGQNGVAGLPPLPSANSAGLRHHFWCNRRKCDLVLASKSTAAPKFYDYFRPVKKSSRKGADLHNLNALAGVQNGWLGRTKKCLIRPCRIGSASQEFVSPHDTESPFFLLS